MLKTCSKCGVDKDAEKDFHRDTRTGGTRSRCKPCTNRENIDRAAANPEQHNARTRAWRAANPGRASAISRAWQLRNPEKAKAVKWRGQYGIDFNAIWHSQNGLCAACGLAMQDEGKDPESVTVDHDRSCCHGRKSCGKCVRGLIHRNCNLVLGYARDQIHVLKSAIEYLERWELVSKQKAAG
jgi:hypothetical protein